MPKRLRKGRQTRDRRILQEEQVTWLDTLAQIRAHTPEQAEQFEMVLRLAAAADGATA